MKIILISICFSLSVLFCESSVQKMKIENSQILFRDGIGDLNQDGTIDILDVHLISEIILEIVTPDDFLTFAADLNQDGEIDELDRIILVNVIVDPYHTTLPNYFLNLPGNGSFVDLDLEDFNPPWTIECNINKNTVTPFSHLLTASDGGTGIRLEQWYNNNQIGITDYGTADYFFGYQLPAGIWVHLAVVAQLNQSTLYINGFHAGTINATVQCPVDMIGLDNQLGAMNAKIDNLRIWNTALNQATINTYKDSLHLFNHPNYSQLKGYFKFNEGIGNIVINSADTSGNGINYGGIYEQIFPNDVGVSTLDSPTTGATNYGSSEPVQVTIANYGMNTINTDFILTYILNDGEEVIMPVNASENPFLPNSTLQINFPNVDLSFSSVHHFLIYTSFPEDENPTNDTLDVYIYQANNVIGDITDFSISTGNDTVTINDNLTEFRILFYMDDIFRIWMTPNGIFEDPAGPDIIVFDQNPIPVETSDEGDYYKISTNSVSLRAYKTPLKFAMYDGNNSTVIWEEAAPISFGNQTKQRLIRGQTEQFYGCGMQNGYFSHRNQSVQIRLQINGWGDGAVPGPSPFYMSTAGYGSYRNTFKPGTYNFYSTVNLMHEEIRFDSYYFYGPSLKEILDGYTQVTGRPFLPPRWALSFGDADCYTPTISAFYNIAQEYRQLDMPGGWILPNDGYGCGYSNLPVVVDSMETVGFKTGLWTESGVDQQAWEVGTAGIRCSKLDVAWVGSGYQFALDGCRQAYTGIENNSDARGFIWSVCSWAGTQRYSTVWSGDESGNWEYIRFHIPTVTGAGLSGLNCATGDVDGIFGGSGPTYTRDLQWKCFTPVLMVISGWASYDKQPWRRGQPYTDINREYLKLKMRLTPYIYTYCNTAFETGVPTTRAMVLEFPADPITWGTSTQYQFMSGEWFLVAPVYENTFIRNDIYLPEGIWYDYWDGSIYDGNQTLNGYNAPLEKLPVFVKGGAIIPMYPEMLYDGEFPADTLTLDCYPHNQSSFTLYEDDGLTRDHRTGSFSKQTFSMNSQESFINIGVGESIGQYDGKFENRTYFVKVHIDFAPETIFVDNTQFQEYPDLNSLNSAENGWCFADNVVYVKTQSMSTSIPFDIEIIN